ncbi:MAG: hypothetical protein FWH55_05290 [Oscillospiraceae bacterium]|nr:hypothetical protein [Oscillospiraceae bacterium]
MKKTFRKAVCIALVLAFCLSLFSSVTYALADDEPALDRSALSMLLGGSLETLTVTGVPEGTDITWASDDLRVARVSNGKVVSVGEGTANITAQVGEKTLTCVVTVHSDDLLVANDVFILDTDGNPIYAHMSSIYKYKEGEPYYWYGVSSGSNVSYYDTLKTGNGTPGGGGTSTVRCYSSYNLVDWKFEGVVCTSGQGGWSGFGRMGVVYCPATDTYVLASQGGGGIAFGDSDTPQGPFTYRGVKTLNNLLPDPCITAGPGDMTMYYDNNTGRAYIVYCSNNVDIGGSQDLWHTLAERGVCYIAELDENDGFLSIKANYEFYDTKKDTYYNLRREGGREANCMFYYDGWYYNAASGLAGWNVSPSFYMGGARTPIDKTYTNEVGLPNNMTPMRGSNSNFSHSSQVVGFVTIDTPVTEQAPKGQLVLEFADRWCDKLSNHTGGHGIGYYVFAPLSFLDPQTAPPTTKEDEPKTPNPLQYKLKPDGTPNVDYYPWGDAESYYPFLPEGYPYGEWKRPDWDIPVFNSLSQFYLDIENGTWEPGPNNNYLDNPEFEQDRLDKSEYMTWDGIRTTAANADVRYPVIQDYVNEPNGWKAEHIAGQTAQINYGGNRNNTETDRVWQLIAPGSTTQNWYSSWAGNYTWYHGYTKRNLGTDPYKTRTYQSVDLPNGLYNFYGWVRSSGGQNEAYVYAGDQKVDISDPIDSWTLVTFEDILVTDGQIEVGFYSDAEADQWAFFDDFALIAAPVAKSELATLVAEAQTVNSAAYTSADWAELSDALDEAEALLEDDDARQTWINAAWAKLYLAINNPIDAVKAKISADAASVGLNTAASYTVSLENANGAGVITLSIIADGRYLDLTTATGLNGFSILEQLSWEYIGGQMWKGAVKLYCPGFVQSNNPLDVLKISGVTLDLLGDTKVTLTSFAVTGDVNGVSRTMPSVITAAEAVTSVVFKTVFSKYDLNHDGKIDELDLAIVVYYYLANDLEADWDVVKFDIASAKDCDVALNGRVDLADMIEVIANYCDSY